MTLIPCKIEDIPALIHPSYASRRKAELLSFLAMETPAVKVEGIGNASNKQASLSQVIKKEGYPIKALTRKGDLYLINTAKMPEYAV